MDSRCTHIAFACAWGRGVTLTDPSESYAPFARRSWRWPGGGGAVRLYLRVRYGHRRQMPPATLLLNANFALRIAVATTAACRQENSACVV